MLNQEAYQRTMAPARWWKQPRCSKSGRFLHKDTVIARIHEAEKVDRLCLSPQCGFASCEIGNKLTGLQQWNKLKLVKEIAKTVWGK